MTGEEGKVGLVHDLMDLLPIIKAEAAASKEAEAGKKDFYHRYLRKKYNDEDLSALLMFGAALHSIFSSNNKLIDAKGFMYAISTKKELISIFLMASANRLILKKSVLEGHLNFYARFSSKIEDGWVYQLLFDRLNHLGYDLLYSGHCAGRDIAEHSVLNRVGLLIESLRKFSIEHRFKDKFKEEQLLLNKLNLPLLRQQVQDQILVKQFEGMSPCKVVVAYYKAYQKLPPGY